MAELKLKKGGQYRLKNSMVVVVCVLLEEKSSYIPQGTRLAWFEYFKKNMDYEEVPFSIPEPLWVEYLTPKEVPAFA